jgi:hypothetical protein
VTAWLQDLEEEEEEEEEEEILYSDGLLKGATKGEIVNGAESFLG